MKNVEALSHEPDHDQFARATPGPDLAKTGLLPSLPAHTVASEAVLATTGPNWDEKQFGEAPFGPETVKRMRKIAVVNAHAYALLFEKGVIDADGDAI